MKIISFSLLLLCLFKGASAQKDIKVTYDSIKAQCSGLAPEKRIRITVARFNNTTGGVTGSNTTDGPTTGVGVLASLLAKQGASQNKNFDLGGNLATMLTNALQGVNCYTVLESLKNKQDMDNEIDEGNSGYADKKSAPKKGKQLGAQVVVTGEVIEYSLKKHGIIIAGVGVQKKIAKIGFNLKIVNPETREVLFSQIIHVEAKTGDGVNVFGGLVSTENEDPAVEAALEKGVAEAVQLIASQKNRIALTNSTTGATAIGGTTQTAITLVNANYTSFSAFASLLNGIACFKSMEKSLASGTATYTVQHTGTSDALLEELNKRVGSNYEVVGFGDGKIELKVK